jgi:hypothetical protein
MSKVNRYLKTLEIGTVKDGDKNNYIIEESRVKFCFSS